MDDIFKFADYVIKSWNDFRKWYDYENGKEIYAKYIKQAEKENLMLLETRVVADIWRKYKPLHGDEKIKIHLEQAVWLTLCLEWGEDSEVRFCYSNDEVHVINERLFLRAVI